MQRIKWLSISSLFFTQYSCIIVVYSFFSQSLYEAISISSPGVYISLRFNQKFGNTSTVIGSIYGGGGVLLPAKPPIRVIKLSSRIKPVF
jgi:hypothetical protein